jgi:hypothetical protein
MVRCLVTMARWVIVGNGWEWNPDQRPNGRDTRVCRPSPALEGPGGSGRPALAGWRTGLGRARADVQRA